MKKLMMIFTMFFVVAIVNAQTKTEIKSADLPKAITDNIAKDYAGYNIAKAFKVDTKGTISYRVMVKDAKGELILFYDKDGNFVRKQAPQAHKPAPAPKPKAPNK
jgi:hypothetical protein